MQNYPSDSTPSINSPSALNSTPSGLFDLLRARYVPSAEYNSRQRHFEHASTCFPGTREDVTRRILEWASSDDLLSPSVCWLHGTAGSGKSTIANTIAQQAHSSQTLLATFFFARGKPRRCNVSQLLPTLAAQIARRHPATRDLLLLALQKDPSLPYKSLSEQFQNLVVDPVRYSVGPHSSQAQLIVIDALDECEGEGEEQFIQLLQEYGRHPTRIRFLLTSRPEPYIQSSFRTTASGKPASHPLSLPLSDFNARDDLRHYLCSHLSGIHSDAVDTRTKSHAQWPSEATLDALIDRSDALFLYVCTLVRFLGDISGPSPSRKLEVVLDTLHPTGGAIDALYTTVLSLVGESQDFFRIVGPLLALRWALPIDELGRLMQMEVQDIRCALRGCGSVFIIPPEDDDDTMDGSDRGEEDRSIRAYHPSLLDFFGNSERSGQYHLDPARGHAVLLSHCLAYIHQELGIRPGAGIIRKVRMGKALIYASKFWCAHLNAVLGSPWGDDVCAEVVMFLRALLADGAEEVKGRERWMAMFQNLVEVMVFRCELRVALDHAKTRDGSWADLATCLATLLGRFTDLNVLSCHMKLINRGER